MKTLWLFLLFSISTFAQDDVLEFIKSNYEYNINLIEETYKEHGVYLKLRDEDRTINLEALEVIQRKHPVAEFIAKTEVLKKRFLKDLTPLEKQLLEKYPKQSYYVAFESYFALSKTKEIYKKDYIGKPIDIADPKVDSFKHTYWSHRLTTNINSEFAKLWFTARELREHTSGLIDLRDNSSGYMDMLNNVTGMKIPEDTFMDRLLGASVPSQITRKQKYGQLFFNDHGVIRTTDRID